MVQLLTHSPAFQHKLIRLADLLEQAGRLMREMSGAQPHFTPVASVKRPNDVPKDQEWFWSAEWQAGEREVDNDLASGRYAVFSNMEEMLADLHAQV